MVWFRVDDSFYDHPKAFDAPDCAVALWTRAGTWSARNLQDGFVPANLPARLCDEPERAVKELIERGLWRRTKGGYQFHDWAEYQITRSEVLASREKNSSGGVIGNHRRWHVAKGVVEPSCRYCQEKHSSDTDQGTDRGSESGSDSPPNPPVPARPGDSSSNYHKEDFAEFWKVLPHRKGDSRHKAELAYVAARNRGVAHAVMLAHAEAYAAERQGKDRQFTKGGEAWIHSRPWDDNPEPEQAVAQRPLWPWEQ